MSSPKKDLPGMEDEVDAVFGDQPVPGEHSKFQIFWYEFKSTLGQGDLAGFQLFWTLLSFIFLIIKIGGWVDLIAAIQWWTIFIVPLLNAILTGIFDFLVRKYGNPDHIESLIKKRFAVLFLIKLGMAVFVFSFWLFAKYGFIDKFDLNNPNGKYSSDGKWGYCICQVWTIFIACVLAIIVSELIITTNIINSEQNLSLDTPNTVRIILLIIRPVVWVYNRAMIMFLSFYVFYGTIYLIFTIGIICDLQCDFDRCRSDLQIVGVQCLVIPFSVPYYLGTFLDAYPDLQIISDDDLTERIVLTFLVTSFWVDVLNGCVQFIRRFILFPLFPSVCPLDKPVLHQHSHSMRNTMHENPFNTKHTDHKLPQSLQLSFGNSDSRLPYGTYATQVKHAKELKKAQNNPLKDILNTPQSSQITPSNTNNNNDNDNKPTKQTNKTSVTFSPVTPESHQEFQTKLQDDTSGSYSKSNDDITLITADNMNNLTERQLSTISEKSKSNLSTHGSLGRDIDRDRDRDKDRHRDRGRRDSEYSQISGVSRTSDHHQSSRGRNNDRDTDGDGHHNGREDHRDRHKYRDRERDRNERGNRGNRRDNRDRDSDRDGDRDGYRKRKNRSKDRNRDRSDDRYDDRNRSRGNSRHGRNDSSPWEKDRSDDDYNGDNKYEKYVRRRSKGRKREPKRVDSESVI